MYYLSPFDLAELSPELVFSSEDLKRAKSKLLANFEIEGTVTIHFAGQELDRNSALKTLELLSDPVAVENLREVERNPVLKRFLQTGDFAAISSLETEPALSDDLLDYIGNWFAPVFNQCMKEQLNKSRFKQVLTLMGYAHWISATDYKTAFKVLVDLAQNIRLHSWKGGLSIDEHTAIFTPEFPKAVALLPNVFRIYKEDLAHTMYDRARKLLSRGERNQALQLLLYTAPLPISPGLSEDIQKLIAEIKKLAQTISQTEDDAYKRYQEAKTKKKSPILGIIALVIAAILIGIVVANRTGSSTSRDVSTMDYKDKLDIRIANSMFFTRLEMAIMVEPPLVRISPDTTWPETGTAPYEASIPLVNPCRSQCVTIAIENNSGLDGVAFIQDQDNLNEIVRHVYIRNGDKFSLKPVYPGSYKMRWYAGSGWKPQEMEYNGQKLGVFQANIVRPYNTDSLEKITWLSLLLRDREPNVNITIRGDSLFTDN